MQRARTPYAAVLLLTLVTLGLLGTAGGNPRAVTVTHVMLQTDDSPSAPETPTSVSVFAPYVATHRVCLRDDTWTRPPDDDLRTHLVADQRYVGSRSSTTGTPIPALDDRARASFWRDYLSASLESTIIRTSGLWSLGDDRELVRRMSEGCPPLATTLRLNQLKLWLLQYEATEVKIEPTRIVVRVRPLAAGFQVIEFEQPFGVAQAGVQLVFVNPAGQMLQSIPANELSSH